MTIASYRTQLPGQSLRNIKNTIAIGSGKGGVGKSTATVSLALTLAKQGRRVGILDADIYGPSMPQMLGKQAEVKIIDDKYQPVMVEGIQVMSMGYLLQDDKMPLIWRGPMLAKSLIQMLDKTAWDNLDYLLIDLPPGTGDIQLSLVQKIPLTAALVVTTPQTVATNDAGKALGMFEKTSIHVLGIIENMATYTCSACGHESHVFGHGGGNRLAQQYDAPLLGSVPLSADICKNSDGAHLVAHPAYQTIAKQMEEQLEKRPLNYADTFPPIVVE